MKRLVLLLPFFLIFTGCTQVSNPPPTPEPAPVPAPIVIPVGTASGVVKAKDGNLMVNARVYIGTLEAFTDASGSYVLTGIPTGSAIVSCSGYDNKTAYDQYYAISSETITISDAATTSLDFILPPILEMKNVSISQYSSTLDWIQVLGEITNNTASTKRYVKVQTTVKDPSGTIVASDFAYVSSTDLDSGSTSTFQIIFSGINYSNLSQYTFSYQVVSW